MNFQNGESRDNLVICERRGTVPGDKATEGTEWLINHFCEKEDLVLCLNTSTALKAAIKNGRYCVVNDRANFKCSRRNKGIHKERISCKLLKREDIQLFVSVEIFVECSSYIIFILMLFFILKFIDS